MPRPQPPLQCQLGRLCGQYQQQLLTPMPGWLREGSQGQALGPSLAALSTPREVLRHSASSPTLPTATNTKRYNPPSPEQPLPWMPQRGQQRPVKTTTRDTNRTSAVGCPVSPSNYLSSDTLHGRLANGGTGLNYTGFFCRPAGGTHASRI